MDVMMEGTEEGKYVVDTNDEAFVAPADMEEAIKEYVRSHNMGEIKSRGELVRLVYDSLAYTYAETEMAGITRPHDNGNAAIERADGIRPYGRIDGVPAFWGRSGAPGPSRPTRSPGPAPQRPGRRKIPPA